MILEKVKNKYGEDHPRFKHIMGVRKLILQLAKKYGVDEKKAEIAALVHDYYRHEDINLLKQMVGEEIVLKYQNSPINYHAYASAKALKECFQIDDEEIFNAVQNHVHGRINMSKLEEILLIADFAEENRTNPGSLEVRKLLDIDYDKALYLTFALPYDFLASNRGVIFSEEQLAVRDFYHLRWIKRHCYQSLKPNEIEFLENEINLLDKGFEKRELNRQKIILILKHFNFSKEILETYFLLDEKTLREVINK